MSTLLHDLRIAARSLKRTPGFTFVAVLTLALGIGAGTAIFSVVNGVLLRSLPFPEPDALVRVWNVGPEGGRGGTISYPNVQDLSERNRTLSGLAVYFPAELSAWIDGELERIDVAAVSESFFDVLGVRPVLGRLPSPEEWRWEAPPAAVVSHGFWQRRLGGSPEVLGTTIEAEGLLVTVVGVLPPGLGFPESVDAWFPRPPQPESRTAHNWIVIGRLASGTPLAAAQTELSAIAARLADEYGDDTWMHDVELQPLREAVVGSVRPALLLLLGASGLLLLIACGNVVNLLLARATARQREAAIRIALGAGRGRLVQYFLAESAVITLAGGALGVLLAAWGVPALLALAPTSLPRMGEVRIDGAVLGFAIAASGAAAMAMGLLAGTRASRGEVREALVAGGRAPAGTGHRVRAVLVAGQVALTVVLLIGAGLLSRSFLKVVSVDPGFRAENVVVLHLAHDPAEGESELARRTLFYDELTERLRAVPGVAEVGVTIRVPLTGTGWGGQFLIVDRQEDVTNFDEWRVFSRNPDRVGQAEFRGASTGYFRALGIPLLRGRLFDERDSPSAPHVAVISESLARERWPDEDPIGKRIQFGNMDGDLRIFTIVGIVGDVREASLELEPRPTFYGNIGQRSAMTSSGAILTLRVQGAPGAVVNAARSTALELDPAISVQVQGFDEILAASLAGRRFTLLLMGVFALTALLIAAVGLYGVIAYLVAQRAREVGIRIALGAQTTEVTRMVVAQGARLALIGVGIGIAAALALTRFLAGLVFGVGTADPVTFVGIGILLTTVAIAASWVPARRAARVDPAVALRAE